MRYEWKEFHIDSVVEIMSGEQPTIDRQGRGPWELGKALGIRIPPRFAIGVATYYKL